MLFVINKLVNLPRIQTNPLQHLKNLEVDLVKEKYIFT